jgi:predicted phosphodiesterase
MSQDDRLMTISEAATEIPFDDSSKFILFSDCHRGNGSVSDMFARTEGLFFHALEWYLSNGFVYIELEDGDELWENTEFDEIRRAYAHVFWVMRQFYMEERLYLIFGERDMERQDQRRVEQTLYRYYDDRHQTYRPLFEGIKVHEGLILRHTSTGGKILLVHGHQADRINDRFGWLGRLVFRHGKHLPVLGSFFGFWKYVQLLYIQTEDLQGLWRTSIAKPSARFRVIRNVQEWAQTNNQAVIAGHIHYPLFPAEGEPLFFNTGSCIHPRCIMGIEIQGGEIMLIKWQVKPRADGCLCIMRDVLAGPRRLESIFEAKK